MPSVRFAAVWTALLLAAPWFAVNAGKESSLARFDEMRRDFARHPRAYAAEELAKYFRDHGETVRSLGYYEESVRTFPNNARTRTLLGTSYMFLGRNAEGQAQYDSALAIDPKSWMALDMKAKFALRGNDYASALEIFRKLAPLRPRDVLMWTGYGAAALSQKAYPEAYDAFARANALRPDPVNFYYMGIAAAHLGRWDTAIESLQRATRTAPKDAKSFHALGAAHEGRYAERLRADPGKADRGDLEAAVHLARQARSLDPQDARIESYLKHAEAVLAGTEPAMNAMAP
jgi:tetratricopeptide (TPR) repeat protein